MKIQLRKLIQKKQNSDIVLTENQIDDYYHILTKYNKIRFKDKYSVDLIKINYISFFVSPVIEDINSALRKDPVYNFTKEVIETVKYYRLIKIGSFKVIDIIRHNTKNDMRMLEDIYKNNSKIFFNKEDIEKYLSSDYLIAIYKAIKLKLYKE